MSDADPPFFDSEEQDLIESFERGEWVSEGTPQRLKELQRYARATIAKDKRITFRLSSVDLDALQVKALEEGIPYQTLIASVLHKYVTGRLVPRKEPENTK